MIANRVATTALRRAALKQQSAFFTPSLARALAAITLPTVQTRAASTEKITQSDASSLLASQRRLRPVAPHLAVYDPAQTYFTSSIWQRITGSIFSGALYVYATAYLAAPLVGWHLESASLAAAVAGLPLVVKGSLKFLLAWPFVFHAMNGVRHFVYDVAKGFDRATIKKSSWAIWGVSLVTGLGLAFLW